MEHFFLGTLGVLQIFSIVLNITSIKSKPQAIGFTIGLILIFGYFWTLTQIWDKI
jgi:hypothetical protein